MRGLADFAFYAFTVLLTIGPPLFVGRPGGPAGPICAGIVLSACAVTHLAAEFRHQFDHAIALCIMAVLTCACLWLFVGRVNAASIEYGHSPVGVNRAASVVFLALGFAGNFAGNWLHASCEARRP